MGVTRTANTQAEGLENLIQSIAMMKTMPDADIAFLTSLETQVLQYLRQPTQNLQNPQLPPNQNPTASPGMPPGQTPMSGPPAGPPPGISLPASPLASRLGPMGGGNAGPNPDEMRRMMGR